MSAEMWERGIFVGQQEALMRYGHLTPAELRKLGRAGKISRPVVEFLLAATAARRYASDREG